MSDSENQSLDGPSAAHIVFSEFFFEEAALSNTRFTDVTIILVDGGGKPSYRLHKLILAAHSSFFRHLFRHEPKEVYEIGVVSKKSFEDIISYIYGGTLTLDYNNFDEILDVVIYLQLDKLEELMKAISKLRASIFLGYIKKPHVMCGSRHHTIPSLE